MNQKLLDLQDSINIYFKTRSNGHGDARPIIPDEIADLFLDSLRESSTPFDSEIGVVDTNPFLCFKLLSKGYDNVTLIYDLHPDKIKRSRKEKSDLKELIRTYPVLCKKIGIKFKSVHKKFQCDTIIGLTPFGWGSRDAINYLNKLGDHCKDLRLITSSSVTRESFMNKIRLDLGVDRYTSFETPKTWKKYRLPAFFTEWSHSNREIAPLSPNHKDWEWVSSPDEADGMIYKDGRSAGKVVLKGDENFNKVLYAGIFFKAHRTVVKNLKGLSKSLESSAQNQGNENTFRHCYKSDVVRTYTQTYTK